MERINEMRLSKRVTLLTLVMTMALIFAPLAADAAYETLRPWSIGSAVRSMQQALSALGYSVKVDGTYGPISEAAVRAFQSKNNLQQDGIAGNQTLTLLYTMAPAFDPAGQGGAGATPVYPVGEGSVTPQGRLELGSSGSAVAELQNKLIAKGYSPGRNDGSFDAGTRDAVIAFQKSVGLAADGIAGSNTLAKLSETAPGTQTPAQPEAPGGTPNLTLKLRVGSTGNDVALLQARLTALGYKPGRTDGVYDDPTRAAVVNFQGRNNLKADGIAGPMTLTKLHGNTALGPASSQGGGAAVGTAIVFTGNTGSLRFRSTPSVKDSRNIIGSLNNGQVVELLDGVGSWSRIRVSGREGYVMSQYLKTAGPSDVPSEGEAPQPQAPVTTGTAIVSTQNGGSLRIRSTASSSGNNVLASIPNKATVQVHSSNGTWTHCTWNGRTGYVMSQFLQAVNAPAPADPSSTPGPETEEDGSFLRILRPGDSGQDVYHLQQRLIELKYQLTATSSYDSATVGAVRAFQSINGLKADGVFGPATAGALVSTSARGADSAPLSYSTLRMGDKDGADQAVSKLQRRLAELGFSLSADGSFGIRTHDAVVAFQHQNGISVSGVADAATQAAIYDANAKRNTGAAPSVDLSAGKIGGPGTGSVKLLHWYNEVKPALGGGPTVRVYHPASGVSFNLKIYSLGRHADAEPKTLKDTQLMNGAFGPASWDTRPVYVQLPGGSWTLATMHNYPHLSGSISDNGFGGHLCVHFLRDLEETQQRDPNYGMQNQRAIRKAWKSMTGEEVN